MSDDLRERIAEAAKKYDGHVTNGSIDEIMKIVQPIVDDNVETNQLFELMHAADMRAIKMWQKAHPSNDLVWPDRGNMIFWLLQQFDEIEKAVTRMEDGLRNAKEKREARGS